MEPEILKGTISIIGNVPKTSLGLFFPFVLAGLTAFVVVTVILTRRK